MTDRTNRTAPATSDRLLNLDATRGLAVMGILIVNIIGFSMPSDAYINPVVWGGTGVLDLASWVVTQLFFDGRMRGLFALLFGASALLVMDRAADAGERPVAVHLRRMAALLLIGLVHNYLVWSGDVLVQYALLGLVIWVFRGWPPQRLLLAALIVLTLQVLWQSGTYAGALYFQAQATASGATPELVARYQAMIAGFPSPANPLNAHDLAVHRAGYYEIVAYRTGEQRWWPLFLFQVIAGETLGYMLLGMWLYRSGFFTGGWNRAAIARLAGWGYALSLPALAALTWWAFASGFDPVVLLGTFLGFAIPFRVLCALAHLALASLLIARFAHSGAVARLAATGRMAFTNYLATSVVMTTLFYGYGFDLFGKVDRAACWLFVLGMWAAMLLWSQPWLARYRFGPAEWVWRSLARGRLQPWRRGAI